MKTITFYSYKGGVGRSLALSNIAKRLSEFGKKVCLIDFDLEAPGLHHKFKDNISAGDIQGGLVDYIHYYLENKKTPRLLKEYVTKIKFSGRNKTIDLIAAGNIHSQDYWKKLAMINWNDLFYSDHGQGIELFLDIKERVKKELNPDFLLIDSRTGITEISGITMSLLADEVVILAANNDENIDGTKKIIKSLSLPENNFVNKIPKINVVLCRIPYHQKPEDRQREIRAKNGFKRKISQYLLSNNSQYKLEKLLIIHSDPDLEFEEKLKIGYDHDRTTSIVSPIAIDYLELFEELTNDRLSAAEKRRFNNLIKSEFILKQAIEETDSLTKIKLLDSVIKLNSKSGEAYLHLTESYIQIEDLDNALKTIDKAIELISSGPKFLYAKAFVLRKCNKLDKAESIFNDVLKADPKHYGALSQMGHLFYKKKDYSKALLYFEKQVEYYPEFAGGYNSVGNTYRVLENYEKAFDFIYKALELDPKDISSTGTLAEIYAQIGNDKEFFKNLELAFTFGMTKEHFKKVLEAEDVYQAYMNSERFFQILNKYEINLGS